jgi:uncharacterized damage-inducible protein DinB
MQATAALQETDVLRDSLRRALHGKAWHGASLGELLAGVDAAAAAAHPVPGAHSIWEIVLHVAGWQDAIARRVAGTGPERIEPDADWPPPPADGGEAEWRQALAALWAAEDALDRALAGLPAERLDAPVATSPFDVRTTARGAVEHALYHAGQVALLERAMGREPV